MKDEQNISRTIETTSEDIALTKKKSTDKGNEYYLKDKNTKNKYRLQNDMQPIRKVSDICVLKEIKSKEFIIITYNEDRTLSDLSHIDFSDGTPKVIEHIEWFGMKPDEYMVKATPNNNGLFVGENTYLVHRTSNKDVIYNPIIRGKIEADEIVMTDEFPNRALATRYLSNDGGYDEINFIINTNTIETDVLYSNAQNRCYKIHWEELYQHFPPYQILDGYEKYKFRFDRTFSEDIVKPFEKECEENLARMKKNKPDAIKKLLLKKPNNKK